jgi:hypothetical protein
LHKSDKLNYNKTRKPLQTSSTKEGANRMKLSKELARLYYTAADARKELGLDEEAFQYWVRKDRIKKHLLPGRAQGLYSKREVNALRDQINASILVEEENLEFRKATTEDIEQEARLAHLVFGEKAEAIKERTSFIHKNPDIDFHVYDQGTLTAYINIIPLKHETIETFMQAKVKAWEISPNDIEQFTPGKPLECIIIDMVTTPTVPPRQRAKYGAKLIAGLINTLAEAGKRGVEISKIYAASETPTGIRILKNAGFEIIGEARNGRFSFLLDVMTSNEKLLKEYQEAIKEWKASTQKQSKKATAKAR